MRPGIFFGVVYALELLRDLGGEVAHIERFDHQREQPVEDQQRENENQVGVH